MKEIASTPNHSPTSDPCDAAIITGIVPNWDIISVVRCHMRQTHGWKTMRDNNGLSEQNLVSVVHPLQECLILLLGEIHALFGIVLPIKPVELT